MRTTASITAEGADIVYDQVGRGPVLVTVPGAGGDGRTHARLADALAEDYRIVTLDRRGNGRSGGARELPIDMAQQARDVAAVARAVAGAARVRLFGQSGGGNIALALAAAHPECIDALVVHEPPAIEVLPDAPALRGRNARLQAIYGRAGAEAAFADFVADWAGIDTARILAARARGRGGIDLDHFFGQEHVGLSTFVPDFAALAPYRDAIAVMVGRGSGDAYYARAGRAVARRLGCALHPIAGNHLSFQFEPAAFAGALRAALTQLGG